MQMNEMFWQTLASIQQQRHHEQDMYGRLSNLVTNHCSDAYTCGYMMRELEHLRQTKEGVNLLCAFQEFVVALQLREAK